jgi:monoamine oxidase
VIDVAVVGAGFAGLSAAAALEAAGWTVEVIEARDRVGGKVASVLDQTGAVVDLGGQWVTDDMPRVLELIHRHGLTLVAPHRPDHSLVHPAGDVDRVGELFDEVSSAGGSSSMGDLLRRLPAAERAAVWSSIQVVWCQDPDVVPARFVKAMHELSEIEGEELQYFVAESIHALADRMAADLTGRVRLGVTVTAVERRAEGVTVLTSAGPIEARRVVLAIPPQAAARLPVTPPLEPDLIEACSSFRAGDVLKVLLRYESPMWSGDACIFADPAGMWVTSMASDEPALVAFLGGPLAVSARALTSDDRRRLVLGNIASALGDEALDPVSYLEQDWPPDELGGGGYCAVIVDGDPDHVIGRIREGSGGLTFASTELASSYPGFIEGAIVAGREAAARIIGL